MNSYEIKEVQVGVHRNNPTFKLMRRIPSHTHRGHIISDEQFRVKMDTIMLLDLAHMSEAEVNAKVEEDWIKHLNFSLPNGEGEYPCLKLTDEEIAAHRRADPESRRVMKYANEENGNYSNQCAHCSSMFIGYKGFGSCQLCSDLLTFRRDQREFEFHAKENLGLSTKKLASGEYQSFGAQMAWVTWQYTGGYNSGGNK
ncbi:hypothetical protein Amme1_00088 [Pseudomonas phage vB_PpuM-Amme-1]